MLTISSGPGGRIFLTQIATLFLHIQVFPDINPYLAGSSLPTLYAKVLGLESGWIRSGRVVMEIIKPEAVVNGTAGVMNTVFIGEAYANWGILGVLLAPVLIGFLYSFVICIFLKHKKTPLWIIGYLIIFMNFSQMFIGGFVDYLYPLQIVLMLCVLFGISIVKNRGKMRVVVSKR